METTPDQLRSILAKISNLLNSRADVAPLRFKDYREYSLNLEVYAYINTKDFNEYLKISEEELDLQILNIISETGS